MGLEDFVETIEDVITSSIALKIAVVIGGWHVIPVAAILAQKMHNAGKLGKGNYGEPSKRQVALLAGQLHRSGKVRIVKIRGEYYIRIS